MIDLMVKLKHERSQWVPGTRELFAEESRKAHLGKGTCSHHFCK